MTEQPVSYPYHYREDIHAPKQHQGKLICMKCSLDISLPIHPILWPCSMAEAEIEAAAEAIHMTGTDETHWDDLSRQRKEFRRKQARNALDAARSTQELKP